MEHHSYTPWHRYGLIADLTFRLATVSPWFGKTALQKMVFLLQETEGVGCGYDFELYTHGPFTSHLLGDLDLMESMGAVEVEYVTAYGFSGYRISVGDNSEVVRSKAGGFLKDHGEAIDRIVECFGSLSARELELSATIIYVDRQLTNTAETVNRNDLLARVGRIKPRFHKDTIDRAISSLEQLGYLRLEEAVENTYSEDGRKIRANSEPPVYH